MKKTLEFIQKGLDGPNGLNLGLSAYDSGINTYDC